MGGPVEQKEFSLPLHLQLALRKVELEAKELTWEELYCALLNLYHRSLMQNCAIADMLAEEHIEIDWDMPTEIEINSLLQMDDDDNDDDGDYVVR